MDGLVAQHVDVVDREVAGLVGGLVDDDVAEVGFDTRENERVERGLACAVSFLK